MKNPKISIITPSYNQGQFLEDTILSILEQNYPCFEYIIIDGGSTDNSVEIIKKYEKQLRYWVSEKDRGQTHAICKGFNIATGDYVNWINSDDLLESNALNTLAEAVKKYPGYDVYFGDYRAVDGKGNEIYRRKSAPFNRNALFWGRQLSSQPSVFFRKDLLDRFGYLDETKNFCMDTEFWIRCAKNGAKFKLIKKNIGITRAHCEAKTSNLQDVLHNEHKSIVKCYCALNKFRGNKKLENVYFSALNYFWRLFTAIRRSFFRGDFSFLQATRTLKKINKIK